MNSKPVLSIKEIKKSFGTRDVLRGVNLRVRKGEVVGLVGENGSGKTTLINILSGSISPDHGCIDVEGDAVRFSHPSQALDMGIRTVHQSLGLCQDLSVVENIYLGQEEVRRVFKVPFLRRREMELGVEELFSRMGVSGILPTASTKILSGGQQKTVALARLMKQRAKLYLFDEPTSALGQKQKDLLLKNIKLIKENSAVIYISHNLREVFSVADRIVFLKDGVIKFDKKTNEVSEEEFRNMIISLV